MRSIAIIGVVLACFLIVVLPAVVSQEQPQQPAAPSQPAETERDFLISMHVDLVVLHLTVEDRSGGFVSGLTKENFQIFENDKPQEIRHFRQADVPVTMGLIIDQSVSMMEKRMEVTQAALELLRASNPADEIFVVKFNERVFLTMPKGSPFTGDPETLRRAMDHPVPSGKTALFDAIARGVEHAARGRRDKRILVVLSDGADNASARTLEDTLALAHKHNVIIYTIGLFEEGGDRKPNVLKRLADDTGGEAFLPRTDSRLVRICEHIARDIRHQYVLAFVPADIGRDGAWRKVRVAAQTPGRRPRVRTRAGYFALR